MRNMIYSVCHSRLSILFQRNVNYATLKFSTKKISPCNRNDSGVIMKVLNVAEKNYATKNIATLSDRGNCRHVSRYEVLLSAATQQPK